MVKRCLRCAVILLVSASLVPWEAIDAQQDMADVEITTTELGGGVYMLQGRGGNIGLSTGADGVFVIDDQYAPLTDKILAAIGRITPEPVRFVVNTHWHGDHTGGNENLGKAGAIIVAHENVRKRLNPAEFADLVGRSSQAAPAALPVVTFTDRVTFHWNNQTLRVVHVPPAHTDGDAIIHFAEADIFHMGDIYFRGRYPFIDTESGGNADGVIAAVERVLANTGSRTKIIPGHGDLATPNDLAAYHDMLLTVRNRVAELVAAGRSADEVVAAQPTADFDAEWGDRSEGFIRAMYQAVGGSR